MLYDTPFNDLFESKRQAVVCYLSLERRFIEASKQLRDLAAEESDIIRYGYSEWIHQKPVKSNKPVEVEPTAKAGTIPCAICGCIGYHENCGTL